MWDLKGLSSEIYLAESGINQLVTLKGGGAEVQLILVIPSHVRSPLHVSTIKCKILDMINRFPFTVQYVTLVAAFFF
jgi:hypothetical protein